MKNCGKKTKRVKTKNEERRRSGVGVAFLVELHKYTSAMRRRSEPQKRKVAQRKVFYYLRMTDGKFGFRYQHRRFRASENHGGTVWPDDGDDYP